MGNYSVNDTGRAEDHRLHNLEMGMGSISVMDSGIIICHTYRDWHLHISQRGSAETKD